MKRGNAKRMRKGAIMATEIPIAWIQQTQVGDYQFEWGESAVNCTAKDPATGTNEALFQILFMDYTPLKLHSEIGSLWMPTEPEWVIFLPDHHVRMVKLDADPTERDQSILSIQAIIAFKKLGLGGQLKW